MANLLSPIKFAATPDTGKNIITFEPGPPNEYFDDDLSNWTIYKKDGSETATIVDNRLRLDMVDSIDSDIDVFHNYKLPEGDFTVYYTVSNYTPDYNNPGFYFYCMISGGAGSGHQANIRCRIQNSGTAYRIFATWLVDNVETTDGHIYPATMPNFYKISRVGTIIYIYYYSSGWNLLSSKDYGIFAEELKEIKISINSVSDRGGYVDFDDILIVPENYYFPNDLFNNLNNWYCYNDVGTETVSIIDGKARCTIPDGIDGRQILQNRYSIYNGDFSVEIDLVNYFPNDDDNGVKCGLHAYDLYAGSGWDSTEIEYWVNTSGTNHVVFSKLVLNDNSQNNSISIASQPNKLRIRRIGNIIYTDYYISSWVNVSSRDYGTESNNIKLINIYAADNNLYGGYVEFDNLTLDKGINSYNLYWKKDKCPNCYFTNLDDFEVSMSGSPSYEISNNKLSVSTSGSESIEFDYLYPIQSGNKRIEIDIPVYTLTEGATGAQVWIWLKSDDLNDYLRYMAYIYVAANPARSFSSWKINGVPGNSSSVNIGDFPSKIAIERTGNTILCQYYNSGSWHTFISQDFGSRSQYPNKIMIACTPGTGDVGADIEFDNLTITPSVKNDYDGVINDIVDLTYDHESLDGESVYCYEITAENESGEGDESEEVFGITPLPYPTEISVDNGEEQNTITFTRYSEDTDTNIYWANSPGVTQETGNKISDISSPYTHSSLNPSLTYYYVLTTEDISSESADSSEYNASPLPAPPDNVVATSGTEKNIITFDASLGADSYNLYWKNSSPVTKLTGTKITEVTSPYEHTSLNPALTYYYVVTSVEDIDESEDSLEVNASPAEDVPDTPTNFEVVISGSGDSEIVLSWDLMEYADYYDIYYSTSPGVTKESGTKIGDITDSTYSHQELVEGVYYYIIYAVNEIGESVVSDEVSGTVYFDGKIFDHDSQAKLNLLQQYQKE